MTLTTHVLLALAGAALLAAYVWASVPGAPTPRLLEFLLRPRRAYGLAGALLLSVGAYPLLRGKLGETARSLGFEPAGPAPAWLGAWLVAWGVVFLLSGYTTPWIQWVRRLALAAALAPLALLALALALAGVH